ncbi:MAG TPA: beta-eliminating lyase-related protein [Candidatus Baltobacteraceae bacterium]
MIDAAERARVQRGCTRFVGHPPQPIAERLRAIAHACGEDERADRYGGGELLASFEATIAALLGKEAAVFMPSGTMAQQIALRVHADARRRATVALHPQSHLLLSEAGAIEALHGLRAIPVGDRNRLFTQADLEAIAEPVGAVLFELPERNIGGALRPWDDLLAMTAWAREAGAAAHLDGARLWESQPYYGASYAELSAPFDTAYVSFYKILNAVAGAALAGPKAIIDQARLWQWRHGGRLVAQYPMIVSAREGLKTYLPRIPRYVERARAIARAIGSFDAVTVTPNPPPTNMLHAFVRGDFDRLDAAAMRVAEETGIWLVGAFARGDIPDRQMFELSCGDGSLEISDDDVRDWFERLLRYARVQERA